MKKQIILLPLLLLTSPIALCYNKKTKKTVSVPCCLECVKTAFVGFIRGASEELKKCKEKRNQQIKKIIQKKNN